MQEIAERDERMLPLFRSRFAHQYVRNKSVCLFHSLSRQMVFGNSALGDLFLRFPRVDEKVSLSTQPTTDAVAMLRRKGLLVERGDDDERILGRLRDVARTCHKGRLQLMYLIPSADCNLLCQYCFVGNSLSSYAPMTESIARKSVDYFFAHSKGSASRRIIFYGGEPLLNVPAVLAAADAALLLQKTTSSDSKLFLTLLTNGTLVTREIARALSARHISVSVSVDGPASVHDANRRDRFGEPTFQQAFRALSILQEENANPGISCTVTPASLDAWNEVVRFIVDDSRVQRLGFNILHPQPHSASPVDYRSGQNPAAALIGAFKRFRELGIYEDRVMRRAKPFASRRFHFKDCLGVGGQIAVAPDGSVGPCQALLGEREYFPLHVARDFSTSPYDVPLFREWVERFPLNSAECVDCPAVSICGGGCPVAAMFERGSIWEIDRRVCAQVKPIHEWLVWDVYDQLNGSDPSAAGLERQDPALGP